MWVRRDIPGWGQPVAIRIGTDADQFVHDAQEGLVCLTRLWPLSSGPLRSEAILRCNHAAMDGGNQQRARESFIAAAIEADVLI